MKNKSKLFFVILLFHLLLCSDILLASYNFKIGGLVGAVQNINSPNFTYVLDSTTKDGWNIYHKVMSHYKSISNISENLGFFIDFPIFNNLSISSRFLYNINQGTFFDSLETGTTDFNIQTIDFNPALIYENAFGIDNLYLLGSLNISFPIISNLTSSIIYRKKILNTINVDSLNQPNTRLGLEFGVGWNFSIFNDYIVNPELSYSYYSNYFNDKGTFTPWELSQLKFGAKIGYQDNINPIDAKLDYQKNINLENDMYSVSLGAYLITDFNFISSDIKIKRQTSNLGEIYFEHKNLTMDISYSAGAIVNFNLFDDNINMSIKSGLSSYKGNLEDKYQAGRIEFYYYTLDISPSLFISNLFNKKNLYGILGFDWGFQLESQYLYYYSYIYGQKRTMKVDDESMPFLNIRNALLLGIGLIYDLNDNLKISPDMSLSLPFNSFASEYLFQNTKIYKLRFGINIFIDIENKTHYDE